MRRRVQVGEEFDFSVTFTGDALGQAEISGNQQLRRRHVIVGQPFEAKVAFGRGDTAASKDADTRARIVWAVFGMCALFLLGAAGLGLHTNDFGRLADVWSVVGPVYGVIAGYFFTKK